MSTLIQIKLFKLPCVIILPLCLIIRIILLLLLLLFNLLLFDYYYLIIRIILPDGSLFFLRAVHGKKVILGGSIVFFHFSIVLNHFVKIYAAGPQNIYSWRQSVKIYVILKMFPPFFTKKIEIFHEKNKILIEYPKMQNKH